MSANPHRATVVVSLGVPPVEHDLCLNLNALAEIEAELGVDAPALLVSGMGFRKAVVIIHAGLRATGNKLVDRTTVVAMLDKMKLDDVLRAAAKALMAAFTEPEPNPPQEGASPSEKSPGVS